MSDDLAIQLRILELFLADEAPLLIYPTDAAKRIGCERTRMYRELSALAEAGWLIESEQTRTKAYRLGPKLMRLKQRALDGALHECDQAIRAVYGIADVIRRFGDRHEPTPKPGNGAANVN